MDRFKLVNFVLEARDRRLALGIVKSLLTDLLRGLLDGLSLQAAEHLVVLLLLFLQLHCIFANLELQLLVPLLHQSLLFRIICVFCSQLNNDQRIN